MSTQREVLEQAAPAVLSATQMRALQDARTTAMHWTAKARVPECGEFGRIAQDLDWLANELAAPQQEVPAQPTPSGDAEDAARYRWLALKAYKESAYDRLGLGAYWRIGFHVDDGRLGLDAAIDAARK